MFSSYGQFASTTQFYLYGKRYCTRTGWEAASAKYRIPDILSTDLTLDEHVFMITGANSGIGLGITQYLAMRQATVYLVCRSLEKGTTERDKLIAVSANQKIHLLVCDCGVETDIRRMWREFVAHRESQGGIRLDALICNAGILSNEKIYTTEGIESTFATHLLFGTYLLVSLAMDVLSATKDSRVVVVSSGGMYNTKFPDWDMATSTRAGQTYNGQLVYAYAKRGQVLLCERLAKLHPNVKFVSCHPGWVNTDAVKAAYGDSKKYLEPMRNIWQGCEGIVWLAVVPAKELRSGEFYLDRTVRTKHIAGPFFTEGTFTKNTEREVDEMMRHLQVWSDASTRPAQTPDLTQTSTIIAKPTAPLTGADKAIDIGKYMGRWYVLAEIPSFITRGSVNQSEDYVWDEEKQVVSVSFKYSSLDADGRPYTVNELKQQGTILNPNNTEWSIAMKLVLYWPLGLKYLILDVDDAYSTCMVGVPDRSMLWVMSRTFNKGDEDEIVRRNLQLAATLGYDTGKVVRISHVDFEGEDHKPVNLPSTYAEKESLLLELFDSMNAEEQSVCLDKLWKASSAKQATAAIQDAESKA